MRRAGVLALVGLGALPASAAGAPVVETSSVERSATVAAGATRTLTVGCPGAAVAVGGAAPSGFATLRASVPLADGRRWRFRFAAGTRARRVSAAVRCVALRLPAGIGGVSLVVSSRFDPDLEVPAGQTARAALACPPRRLPTGWGVERARAAVEVAAAVPTRSGWRFAFRNTGPATAVVTPHIRCLGRRQRARGGATHAFAWRRAAFADTTGGARSEVRHACRRGEAALSTGFALDPAGDLRARAAAPAGARGGRWTFGGPRASAETTLICLSLATGFR
jgi:hypothetical protein